MESLEKYTMHVKSMAYLPNFNENGMPETIVLEDQGYYKVGMEPNDLMEQDLRYYGTNLKAIKESVQDLLGKMNMAPVVIPALDMLTWFPTKAFKDPMRAWINAFAVVEFRKINQNICEVVLLNGHIIELDMPLKKLMHQLQQAYSVMAALYIRHQYMQGNIHRVRQTVRWKIKCNQLGYEVLKEDL